MTEEKLHNYDGDIFVVTKAPDTNVYQVRYWNREKPTVSIRVQPIIGDETTWEWQAEGAGRGGDLMTALDAACLKVKADYADEVARQRVIDAGAEAFRNLQSR